MHRRLRTTKRRSPQQAGEPRAEGARSGREEKRRWEAAVAAAQCKEGNLVGSGRGRGRGKPLPREGERREGPVKNQPAAGAGGIIINSRT